MRLYPATAGGVPEDPEPVPAHATTNSLAAKGVTLPVDKLAPVPLLPVCWSSDGVGLVTPVKIITARAENVPLNEKVIEDVVVGFAE